MDTLREAVNETMTLEVTPDKMLAVVSFKPSLGDGKQLGIDEIKKQIHDKGIVYGLDENVLNDIESNRQMEFKYIIARGMVPQKGDDAKSLFHFDVENFNKVQPKENEDGTVDFKSLNIVHNVNKGQVLYEKVPATEGIEGMNVFGEVVRAVKGKDIRLPRGKNVDVLEDGKTLVAGISGRLCYDKHNIYIAPLLVIEKDVDSSTGNVEFVGSILINGSVKNGFKVKATGNIEIHGSVEAAHLEAEGDISVWYGIQGIDKGTVKTNGNLVAKFIQNAKVEATGNVVAEAIMHSQVAASNVYVEKGKGLIVGGQIIASHYITATTMGSSMATQTDLQIGIPPHVMNEFKQIEKKYFTLSEELSKIGQSVNFLTTKQARGELPPDKLELLRKLLITRQQTQSIHRELSSRYKELSESIQDATGGQIKVKNILHSGVKVTMGSLVKYIFEDVTYCTVKRSGADIVIGGY